jgi:hypothetical protein
MAKFPESYSGSQTSRAGGDVTHRKMDELQMYRFEHPHRKQTIARHLEFNNTRFA